MLSKPILTTILSFIILSLVLLGLSKCSTNVSKSSTTGAQAVRIERVIERHTDTLRVLDTVLKYKIKQIEVEPDTVIIHKVDSVYGFTEVYLNARHEASRGFTEIHRRLTDSVHLGRELLKCKDSLDICQTKVKIDTEVINKIDTIIKEVPVVDTKKACSIKEQATIFGLGTLVGITLRSLF